VQGARRSCRVLGDRAGCWAIAQGARVIVQSAADRSRRKPSGAGRRDPRKTRRRPDSGGGRDPTHVGRALGRRRGPPPVAEHAFCRPAQAAFGANGPRHLGRKPSGAGRRDSRRTRRRPDGGVGTDPTRMDPSVGPTPRSTSGRRARGFPACVSGFLRRTVRRRFEVRLKPDTTAAPEKPFPGNAVEGEWSVGDPRSG
jgi:hypothetical protein